MNKRKLASLQIWNEDFYVSPVLSFMDTLTSCHGKMSLSRYNQMRFVVGEVLKRRIENAFPGGKGEMYVEFYLTKSFFEISIRDKGVPGWMDFSYDRENIGKDKKTTENFVLDLFVDQIGMEKLGSNGQRIFIRKNIINPIEFKVPEPYPEIEVLDTNISIRPVVTEEDVIEAIRCIYSEYGYSYSYERLRCIHILGARK